MSDISSYVEIITQFKSLGGAVAVCAFYFVSISKILQETLRRPSYVFIMLMLFCAIRLPSFVMRAIIADQLGKEQVPDFKFFIVHQVLFGVGIFALLYATYTLALDRELLTGVGPTKTSFNRFTGHRIVFWAVATPAIILGTVGPCLGVITDPNRGSALYQASSIIFLVLTVLVAYRAFLAARAELSSGYQYADQSLGGGYGAYILCVVTSLCLLRGCFTVATMENQVKQNNEHLLYPLSVVPEIVAVFLLAARKLVPPPYELPTQTDT